MIELSKKLVTVILVIGGQASSVGADCLIPTGLDALPAGLEPALRGALASGTLPYLWLPLPDTLIGAIIELETPIQFRIGQIFGSAMYNVAAKMHPTALDIWGEDEYRICQDGNADYLSLFESVAMAYAFYYSSSQVIPSLGEAMKPIFENFLGPGLGLPANLLDGSNLDPSTPWGLAKKTVDKYTASLANDGWNADGLLSGDYNVLPYGDFDITGTNGVSYEAYEVNREVDNNIWPWQPLLESDGKGYFSKQEYVAPFVGFTARLYGMDRNHYESFKSPAPEYNYEVEARNVLEFTRVMATNDSQKMRLQFYDSKFTSILPFQINWSIMSGQSEFDFWYTDMVLVNALYDALLLVWKEKIVHNAVRPTTVVHQLLKDEVVNTYAGPFMGAKDIKAKDWQPHIRVMPHAEYPSGSACVCTAFSETMQQLTGSDAISVLPATTVMFPAGSSKTEPGVTPSENITITYTAWSDVAHDCGQSRLFGGMHFEKAVTAANELCSGFIDPVVEKAELLKLGDASGAFAEFGNGDINVSPLEEPTNSEDAIDPRYAEATVVFFPNWDFVEGDDKCVNNQTYPIPGYMRNNLDHYVSPNAEACCWQHYNWNVANCILNSGGAYLGTQEWYVNWQLKMCVKDCNDPSDANCGGFANSWDMLYYAPSECCDMISPDLDVSNCIT